MRTDGPSKVSPGGRPKLVFVLAVAVWAGMAVISYYLWAALIWPIIPPRDLEPSQLLYLAWPALGFLCAVLLLFLRRHRAAYWSAAGLLVLGVVSGFYHLLLDFGAAFFTVIGGA